MSVSSSSSGSLVTEDGEREQRRPEPVDTEPDGNVSSTGVLQQDSGQHCRHQELLTRLDQSSDLDDSEGSDSEPDGEAAALGRYRGDSARDGPATPVGVLRLQEWTRGRFPAHPESLFSEPPPRPGGASLSPLEYFSRYLDWHTWEGVARCTNSRPHPAGATPPIPDGGARGLSWRCQLCHIAFSDRKTRERHMSAKHPLLQPPPPRDRWCGGAVGSARELGHAPLSLAAGSGGGTGPPEHCDPTEPSPTPCHRTPPSCPFAQIRDPPGASLAGPCALEGCRRDSSVRCLKCCVFLCIARADNCFLKFHSQ
nr:PREDICTED: uncharacterized protein LOC102694975 [Lepisosteus oculatus]